MNQQLQNPAIKHSNPLLTNESNASVLHTHEHEHIHEHEHEHEEQKNCCGDCKGGGACKRFLFISEGLFSEEVKGVKE